MKASTLEIIRKVLLAAVLVCLVVSFALPGCSLRSCSLSGCSSDSRPSSSAPSASVTEDFGDFKWPTTGLATLIPEPDSSSETKYGEIASESSRYLHIYIGNVTPEQYATNVEACLAAGFAVDYSKGKTSFYANNEAGYHISASYDTDDAYMSISVDAPKESSSSSAAGASLAAEAAPPAEAPVPAAETSAPAAAPADGIRPEFRASVDSYEAFINEYTESGNPVSMLADYTRFMGQYADTMSKLDAMDEGEMSPQELQYFTDASNRINQRLLSTAGAM